MQESTAGPLEEPLTTVGTVDNHEVMGPETTDTGTTEPEPKGKGTIEDTGPKETEGTIDCQEKSNCKHALCPFCWSDKYIQFIGQDGSIGN